MSASLQEPARHVPTNPPPGRPEAIPTSETHYVSGAPLKDPYPDGAAIADVALGCFWGAERAFWTLKGVYVTAVGYAGGVTPNPTYEEVCGKKTGHTETVRVVFDPAVLTYDALLKQFWEIHDPTQGLRQGNDLGPQYRSAIFTHNDEQARTARASRDAYAHALAQKGIGPITTEILPAEAFYFAEGYHQQYLAKNPNGYCGLAGTGVTCPVAV